MNKSLNIAFFQSQCIFAIYQRPCIFIFISSFYSTSPVNHFSKLTDQKIIRTRSTKRIYRSATAGKLGPKMDQKLTWHLYFPVQNGERKFRFAWVNEGKKICKFAKDREISLAKKKKIFFITIKEFIILFAYLKYQSSQWLTLR